MTREATDELELYDIPPAFQERLLRFLEKHNAVMDVAAYEGGFRVTVDPGGEMTGRTFEDAILDAMGSRAGKQIDRDFGKRVHAWLTGHGAHMTFGAEGDGFVVALSSDTTRGEGADEDFEVALVLAEESYFDREVSGEVLEPLTLPAPTRVMRAEDIAPTVAAVTREAPTLDFGGDRTLPSPAPDFSENARWSRAYVNSLPDTAFLYVAPGGKRDRHGRSHPLSLRHLPYRNRSGRVDRAHLHAALGRAHQPRTDIPEREREQIFHRAQEIYDREFGYAANADHPPPRRRRSGASLGHRDVRHIIETEEARDRSARHRHERPFDPTAPRVHYAKPHHFAVNHGRERYRDKDLLREVELGDSGYVLVLWDTHRPAPYGRSNLGYAFWEPGNEEPLFEGEDYSPAPGTAIDSDESVRGILGFLTLRPGDTDRDWFEEYDERQMAFARGDAEELSLYGMEPDEDFEPPPLVDVA